MESMIDLLHRDGSLDLATIFSFHPSQIAIPWPAFQLLQLNWAALVASVRYEDIIGYLLTGNFLSFKEVRKVNKLASNEDRMRHVLRLAIQRSFNFSILSVFYRLPLHCLN